VSLLEAASDRNGCVHDAPAAPTTANRHVHSRVIVVSAAFLANHDWGDLLPEASLRGGIDLRLPVVPHELPSRSARAPSIPGARRPAAAASAGTATRHHAAGSTWMLNVRNLLSASSNRPNCLIKQAIQPILDAWQTAGGPSARSPHSSRVPTSSARCSPICEPRRVSPCAKSKRPRAARYRTRI